MGGDAFAVLIGTRPEAIKLWPVINALRACGRSVRLLRTGQHPDLLPPIMAELELEADWTLPAAAGTCSAMIRPLQEQIRRMRACCLIVQGDTQSAFAGTAAGALEGIPVAHVEAGLRTGDLRAPFPEEILRIGIARLAGLHFAPTEGARRNLVNENIPASCIEVTGNTVVDAARAMAGTRVRSTEANGVPIILLTVHRREHDGIATRAILAAAAELSRRTDARIIYPVHPRTAAADLESGGNFGNLHRCAPLPYRQFIEILARAQLVISDSGGVQEEAAALGVPCVIAREATERPEVLQGGGAVVAGTDTAAIVRHALAFLNARANYLPSDRLGDGYAGAHIAASLQRRFPAAEHGKRENLSVVNQP